MIDAPAGSVMCKVCDDYANGVHFGVTSCEGCKVSISIQSFYTYHHPYALYPEESNYRTSLKMCIRLWLTFIFFIAV